MNLENHFGFRNYRIHPDDTLWNGHKGTVCVPSNEHGQYPNLKRDMDGWIVRESLYCIYQQFTDADEAISAQVAQCWHCCTEIFFDIGLTLIRSRTTEYYKRFPHGCSCELTAFIVVRTCLEDSTFFPAQSQGLSQTMGFWSSWGETNFVHQISCPEET